ncbi:hypothetical protein OE88DRAFT_1626974 [Heliocybe sulcata]|uniref:Uncharacterized protein n=1 Tax=Heliocybe sulcata TaxID=5364 RepID=A0A5C3N7D3_9AGAM|nr:hypothetical protein OE88DRAFT_1626974 [Heliocybe sulcata]
MSRKRVPAALHSELSEYASLLRALRTSSTLDLTGHLTHPSSAQDEGDNVDSEDDFSLDGEDSRSQVNLDQLDCLREPSPEDAPEESEREKEAGPSTSPSPQRQHRKKSDKKGKGKQVEFDMSDVTPSPSKRRRRDTWTRWPLLAGDVHIPEWSLEDEIRSAAMQTLSQQLLLEFATTSEQAEAEIADDETVPLDALVFSASEHLAHLLSALAAHFPLVEKSMQNRVKPIGWTTVLEVAASSGFADAKTVERLRTRLESIYPRSRPVEPNTIARIELADSHKRNFSELCAAEDLSFLSLPGAQVGKTPLKRPKGKDCIARILCSSDLSSPFW